MGHMFLIAVDAHCKWLEVLCVDSANSAQTVKALRLLFSRIGAPEQIVSDSGNLVYI